MKLFSPSKIQHWVALIGVSLCCVATWGAIHATLAAYRPEKAAENPTPQAVRDSIVPKRNPQTERVVPLLCVPLAVATPHLTTAILAT